MSPRLVWMAPALWLSACASINPPSTSVDAISMAVADVSRPPDDLARDAARRPAELLAFAGVKPGEVVIELQPGGGYWTRLLSKVVGASGHVYAFAVAPPRMPPGGGSGASPNANPGGTQAAPPSNTAIIAPVVAIQHIRGYENILAIQASAGTVEHASIGVPAQADLVWTVQNYHDFHNQYSDLKAFDQAVFRDLKPGGILMVVDHNAATGAGFTQTMTLHRSEVAAVKQEILSAGFEFVADSQILANPADDHSKPVFQLHDQTDRYVLKFRKPLSAANVDHRPSDAVAMQNIYGNTFVLGTAPERFRTIFYHADHTYQEFGLHDMQAAYWYWDADGHNCMYHQFPQKDEGFATCHPWSDAHTHAQLGVSFKEYSDAGQAATVTVVAGHQYPNADHWPN